jgi:hypothetical protein
MGDLYKPRKNSYIGGLGDFLAESSINEEKADLQKYGNQYSSIGDETTSQSFRNNNFLKNGETIGSISKTFENLPGSTSSVGDNQNFLQKLMGGDSGAYNTVQAGLGIGQLGLGLASYLQQKETAEKQGKLLDQQISNNKFEMGNRRKMVEAFNNR